MQSVFTICDHLIARPQKSKGPETHHNWYLINCGRFFKVEKA